MLKKIAFLAVLALPAPALALDCSIYTINQAFWDYKAAEGTYELVYGTFTNLRDGQHSAADDMDTWTVTFEGFRASAKAFDKPLVTEVTIFDPLFSDIAGGGRPPLYLQEWLPGSTGLVFLEQTEAGYVARTELCRPFIYYTEAEVETALNCLNGRRCPKE
jgi:hypothetical protein